MAPPPLPRSLFVALFVTISWAAASFAVAGVIAVLLDRDPVSTPGAPAWGGIVALAVAGIAVWLAVGITARSRSPWAGAAAAGASVYLAMAGLALSASFPLFVEQATSPFVGASAVLAALAVVATWAVMRRSGAPEGSAHPDRR